MKRMKFGVMTDHTTKKKTLGAVLTLSPLLVQRNPFLLNHLLIFRNQKEGE